MWAALRHYQAVLSRIITAEFLTKVGPLLVVVVYAPNNQCSTEDKDHFYCDLRSVMTRANSLTIVMGDFNAAIGETVQGVVGPHGLWRLTTNNGERLVSFATSNGMCVTNTLVTKSNLRIGNCRPVTVCVLCWHHVRVITKLV